MVCVRCVAPMFMRACYVHSGVEEEKKNNIRFRVVSGLLWIVWPKKGHAPQLLSACVHIFVDNSFANCTYELRRVRLNRLFGEKLHSLNLFDAQIYYVLMHSRCCSYLTRVKNLNPAQTGGESMARTHTVKSIPPTQTTPRRFLSNGKNHNCTCIAVAAAPPPPASL